MPNRVGFASFIEDPRDSPRHAMQVLGGAQAEIATGKSTDFKRFDVSSKAVRGTIVTRSDGKPVPSGKVVLRVATGTGEKARYDYQEVALQNGSFSAELRRQGERVKGYYIPAPGFADCESEEKRPG